MNDLHWLRPASLLQPPDIVLRHGPRHLLFYLGVLFAAAQASLPAAHKAAHDDVFCSLCGLLITPNGQNKQRCGMALHPPTLLKAAHTDTHSALTQPEHLRHA